MLLISRYKQSPGECLVDRGGVFRHSGLALSFPLSSLDPAPQGFSLTGHLPAAKMLFINTTHPVVLTATIRMELPPASCDTLEEHDGNS